MLNEITVAGVTFDTNDGESRQKILENFGFGYRYAILVQTTYENERAVEVWIDGKHIGYVPKKYLTEQISYESILLAQICYSQEIGHYYVTLSRITPPTIDDIHEMQIACITYGIPMPLIQDRRAYALHYATLVNSASV